MKKTLLALALLGSVGVSAQAGQVTLYGTVDGGFAYTYDKLNSNNKTLPSNKTSAFKLADSLGETNKFGLKGSEDLGNGLEVGFQLENGFSLANGSFSTPGVLFDREARLYAKGAFGEIAAGRVGALGSAAGTYDMFFANVDAFDGGDKLKTGFNITPTLNNSLTYVTPDFGGFKAYAQYSFSIESPQQDKFSKNDRLWALGATFSQDNFTLSALVNQVLPAKDPDSLLEAKKPISFGLGGNVKFDNVTIYAAGQYAKNPNFLSYYDEDLLNSGLALTVKNNVAFTLGSKITVGQGDFSVAGYLAQAKYDNKSKKLKMMSLNGRYTYNLSARTSVYVGADVGQRKFDTTKNTLFTAYTGLTHNF